jgi:hypothetical protein
VCKQVVHQCLWIPFSQLGAKSGLLDQQGANTRAARGGTGSGGVPTHGVMGQHGTSEDMTAWATVAAAAEAAAEAVVFWGWGLVGGCHVGWVATGWHLALFGGNRIACTHCLTASKQWLNQLAPQNTAEQHSRVQTTRTGLIPHLQINVCLRQDTRRAGSHLRRRKGTYSVCVCV